MLYREGDTHKKNGHPCDLIMVEPRNIEHYVSIGWSTKWPIEKKVEEGISNDDIREAAKEAGIDGWDTKRISTLKGLLNGDNKG